MKGFLDWMFDLRRASDGVAAGLCPAPQSGGGSGEGAPQDAQGRRQGPGWRLDVTIQVSGFSSPLTWSLYESSPQRPARPSGRAGRAFGLWPGSACARRGRPAGQHSERRFPDRRGRHVPEPDLFEVVQRVQQEDRGSRSTISRSAPAAVSSSLPRGTVDFGATDGPMTDEQLRAVGGQVLHIPTVIGAVVLTWNLSFPRREPAQVRRPDHRRHLSRQDHQVERQAGWSASIRA